MVIRTLVDSVIYFRRILLASTIITSSRGSATFSIGNSSRPLDASDTKVLRRLVWRNVRDEHALNRNDHHWSGSSLMLFIIPCDAVFPGVVYVPLPVRVIITYRQRVESMRAIGVLRL